MGNIYLRPLTVSDAAISYKWRNDLSLWKYTGSRPDIQVTEEIERDWASRVIANPTRANFAICKNDGKYIGNIYLVNLHDGVGELGVFIGDRESHGRGFGFLALEELKFIAKQKMGLNAIMINVDEKNIPALRTYERSGAERTSEGGVLPVGRFWMKIDLSSERES